MNPKKCPRCGAILLKEEWESEEKIANETLPQPHIEASVCHGGSHDVSEASKINYVYRCPKCGYLLIDW